MNQTYHQNVLRLVNKRHQLSNRQRSVVTVQINSLRTPLYTRRPGVLGSLLLWSQYIALKGNNERVNMAKAGVFFF